MKGNQWGAADERSRTTTEAYADLAGAICEKAVKDYITYYRAVQAGNRHVKTDVFLLEKFFRGEWFMQLTNGNIDGEYIIAEARKKCRISRNT